MTDALPGLLVCQETLQPLLRTDEGLWSEAAQRLYPVKDGLVYMGYPQRDASMITETMQEEREWQGTTDTLDRDADFLRESAPMAVSFINLVSSFVEPSRSPRMLELGSGSGWVSWLFAEAGYDVHLCDFEANSLAFGRQFQHPAMAEGKRIVSDARYAPFADGTFDVVVFKEFVHHVEDYDALFREANRVLRPGGYVALLEPTMNLVTKIYRARHPDPHKGHRTTWPVRYLQSLRRHGLKPVRVAAVYDGRTPRLPPLRALKKRAAKRAANMAQLDVFDQIHLHVAGGAQFVVIAQKIGETRQPPRPVMTTIDPSTMVVTDKSYEEYGRLVPLVSDAARALRPLSNRSGP
jgi:SAM-dependent methyltransferase